MQIISWLSLIVSGLSVMMSAISVIYSAKNHRLIIKKNEINQAKKITCWLVESGMLDFVGQCVISNSSTECVYNVICFLRPNTQSKDELTKNFFQNLGPGEYDYKEIFPPQSKSNFAFQENTAMGNEHLVPQLLFTDSNNVQWFRHANGNLEQFQYTELVTSAHIMPPKYVS